MPKDVSFKVGCSKLEKSYINPGRIRFKIIRLFIISNFWHIIPHIVFLKSQLPNFVQKSFCTAHRAINPTFQMWYVLAFQHVYCQINEINAKCKVFFFKQPVYQNVIYMTIVWTQLWLTGCFIAREFKESKKDRLQTIP